MPSRMLLVTSNFPPMVGGSASVYASLARSKPSDILVLAPSWNYLTGARLAGWREHDRDAPFRTFRLPLLRTRIQSSGPRWWARISLIASDIVIRAAVICRIVAAIALHRVRAICVGELLASAWIIRLFRHVPGIRVLVYVHGEEITTVDSYDPYHERARRGLRDADHIIVVSRFTYRAVQELLGDGADDRLTLLENGVDGKRFTPGPRSPDLVRGHGLEGRFTFVSVCRLLEKKGIDVALRALPAVIAAHPDTRYVIVGDGDYAPQLRALADELGLSENVVFTGRVPEDRLADYYRLGDVSVMPNRRLPNGDTEGFGLVFLEANSCGLPVLAGRDGGSCDAVTDGYNGLVVDGASVEEVGKAMLRLRSDAELRASLAAGGLARSASAGWDAKAEHLVRLSEPPSPRAAPEDMESWPQIALTTALSLAILVVALPYLLLLRASTWISRRHSGLQKA